MEKYTKNNSPVPKGTLLIIGGKEDKSTNDKNDIDAEILRRFIELTGTDNPRIEVITTGSQLGAEVFDDYKKIFDALEVKTVQHIHHNVRKNILEDNLKERIDNADAIFIAGGDQLLLTSIYGGTEFLTQIKQRYVSETLVVGGTSAGAMALSTPMIFAGNKNKQQITGEIKITTGLEFLKDVCIDTHFIDRSRFIRMAQVIATNPTSIGIGIEEDTAIIVRKGCEAEVVGSGIVTIIEGFDITGSNIAEFGNNNVVNIENLKVHLLSKGCSYRIPQINPPHK